MVDQNCRESDNNYSKKFICFIRLNTYEMTSEFMIMFVQRYKNEYRNEMIYKQRCPRDRK